MLRPVFTAQGLKTPASAGREYCRRRSARDCIVKIAGEINYQVGLQFDLEIKRIVVICGRKGSVEQLTE
jgi:hypothetical protein